MNPSSGGALLLPAHQISDPELEFFTNLRKLIGRCLVERALTLSLPQYLQHGELVGRHFHVHGLLDVIYEGWRIASEAKPMPHYRDRSNKRLLSPLGNGSAL